VVSGQSGGHKDKQAWILKVEALVQELWLEYRGKTQITPSATTGFYTTAVKAKDLYLCSQSQAS